AYTGRGIRVDSAGRHGRHQRTPGTEPGRRQDRADQAPAPRRRPSRRRWGRAGGWTSPVPGLPTETTPRAVMAGAFVFAQEDSMFEGQPQAELDQMIKGNREFKQLYQRHKELDKKVLDAELGVLPIDDTTLSQMKREKLAAKDRLTRLYDTLQH